MSYALSNAACMQIVTFKAGVLTNGKGSSAEFKSATNSLQSAVPAGTVLEGVWLYIEAKREASGMSARPTLGSRHMLRLPVAPAHLQQQQQTPMWILRLTEVQPVSANVSPIALHDLKRSWMNWFTGNGACLNGSLPYYRPMNMGWDRL